MIMIWLGAFIMSYTKFGDWYLMPLYFTFLTLVGIEFIIYMHLFFNYMGKRK